MQISEAALNKGFTLLEIIIVLTIISISSTSFYLLLRQPLTEESLEAKINNFQQLSLYTGSTYSFSKESINIYIDGQWLQLEDFDTSYVQSYVDLKGNKEIIKKNDIYLIIAPGLEFSATELILNNGESVELN